MTKALESEEPLVSVVVLCYKNAPLLKGMLDTIFQQDYPRIQLIVSDDGSYDFRASTVEEYITENITPNIESWTVRKNKENLGTVRHINEALQLVQGEYVIFTAADDRFIGDDVFTLYVEQFHQHPEQYWLVAQCNVLTPDYQRSIYVTPTPEDVSRLQSGNTQMIFSRWSRRGIAIPCSMAFHRNAFSLVGGIDLRYQYLEDWPLVLKLLRNGYAPIYMPRVTAAHSSGGVTNSNDRYGITVRKAFYEDKAKVFKYEVDPYLDMLLAEDKKAYFKYQKEIMERQYFLDIDCPTHSLIGKLKLMLSRPVRAVWFFEKKFLQYQHRLQCKKMLLAAHILLLFSMVFLILDTNLPFSLVYTIIGYLDFILALILLAISIIAFGLKRYFSLKSKIRKTLVN